MSFGLDTTDIDSSLLSHHSRGLLSFARFKLGHGVARLAGEAHA